MEIKLLEPSKNIFDSDPFAKFHKYWARKPLQITSHFLETYSKKGDVILDPFMGSGTTLYASMLSDRESIGYDLNPTACFIAKTISGIHITVSDFDIGLQSVALEVGNQINSLYSTGSSTILWRSMGKDSDGLHKAQVADFDFKNKTFTKINVSAEQNLKSKFLSTEFPPFLKDRFSSKGIRKVSEMFTNRNLLAI